MTTSAPSPAELQAILARIPQLQAAGEIHAAPLEGVISLNNFNYHVHVDGSDYLLRAAAETAHYLGIRRDEELACTAAAAQAGIAPELIYTDPQGNLLSRFIQGRHWESADFHTPAAMARLGDVLSRLHAIQGVPAEGSVLRRIERLLDSAHTLGLEIPPPARLLLERLRTKDRPPRFPGLSHNDFWPNNFLDDGEKLYLVDWEFSGHGDGLYDLASISIGAGYDPQEQHALLAAYGAPQPDVFAELQEMKNVVLFFESAWALVMHGLRGSSGYDYLGGAQRLYQIIADSMNGLIPKP
jgi:thiamine kinase-like enzyme